MTKATTVGLTGGIGSGKSTVAFIFSLLGSPVYDSDQRAKALMNEDTELRASLTEAFGEMIWTPDGTLNRKELASIVFDDTQALSALNALVHPVVGRDFARWVKLHSTKAYLVKEAALIFEAGLHKELDSVITVFAPKDERIRRVVGRDNTTEEAVRSRMKAQWDDVDKMALSDFVIANHDAKPLIRQVLEIHNLLTGT